MEEVLKVIKMPAIIGVSAAVIGGIVKKVTGWKTGVELSAGSMFKEFFLVTTSAAIVELAREEKKPFS